MVILSDEQLIISTEKKVFSNTNINEKVSLFNKTIFNFLNNYISHEALLSNGKDPPCFNSQIKSLIASENKLCKNCQRFKSNSHLLKKLNQNRIITQEW